MANWKRIIVGDAFKVSSGGFNQLRDLFLVWPFLIFSIVAVSGLFGPHPTDRSYAIKSAICAVLAALLAKESLLLVAGALAYISIRLAIALIFVHDSKVLLALILSGGILFAIVRLPLSRTGRRVTRRKRACIFSTSSWVSQALVSRWSLQGGYSLSSEIAPLTAAAPQRSAPLAPTSQSS